MIIVLPWDKCRLAAKDAIERTVSSLELGLKEGKCPEQRAISWSIDVWAALPEMAISHALKLPYNGCGVVNGKFQKSVDVGKAVEVRTVEGGYLRKVNHLLVRPRDRDDARYVLVGFLGPTTDGLTFKVLGWIYGHEAKKPLWWGLKSKQGEDPYAYWVHENQLRVFDPDDAGWD